MCNLCWSSYPDSSKSRKRWDWGRNQPCACKLLILPFHNDLRLSLRVPLWWPLLILFCSQDAVPRPIARLSVTVVAVALSLFVLRSFLNTVVFALVCSLFLFGIQLYSLTGFFLGGEASEQKSHLLASQLQCLAFYKHVFFCTDSLHWNFCPSSCNSTPRSFSFNWKQLSHAT